MEEFCNGEHLSGLFFLVRKFVHLLACKEEGKVMHAIKPVHVLVKENKALWE